MQDLASASQFAGKFPVPVWRAAELQVHARMVPVQGMWERWESAFQAIHPVLLKPSLDPGLELTLQRLVTMGPEAIAGIRSRVIADIRARWDEAFNPILAPCAACVHFARQIYSSTPFVHLTAPRLWLPGSRFF